MEDAFESFREGWDWAWSLAQEGLAVAWEIKPSRSVLFGLGVLAAAFVFRLIISIAWGAIQGLFEGLFGTGSTKEVPASKDEPKAKEG